MKITEHTFAYITDVHNRINHFDTGLMLIGNDLEQFGLYVDHP